MAAEARVVHIAPGEPFGGVQTVVVQLAAAQSARERDVSVIWTGASRNAVAMSERVGLRAVPAKGNLVKRFSLLRAELHRSAPDIVHLHMPPPWVSLILPLASSLTCVHLHGKRTASRSTSARIGARLEDRILSRADVLVAISSWIEAAWRNLHPTATFAQVFNGVPVPEETRLIHQHKPRDHPTIGFASRLATDKGVREFADVVLEMNKLMPHARFLIAGEGPERETLEHTLAPLIQRAVVYLLGHVQDMSSFWAQLDLAAFCAPNEPFGLRLIEPVAHGVPVIAYRTGAGSDEIADLCAGIKTVPYGEPAKLAALGMDLLGDEGRRAQIGIAGLRDVRSHFSIDAMADAIDAVYDAAWTRRFRDV